MLEGEGGGKGEGRCVQMGCFTGLLLSSHFPFMRWPNMACPIVLSNPSLFCFSLVWWLIMTVSLTEYWSEILLGKCFQRVSWSGRWGEEEQHHWVGWGLGGTPVKRGRACLDGCSALPEWTNICCHPDSLVSEPTPFSLWTPACSSKYLIKPRKQEGRGQPMTFFYCLDSFMS